MIDDQHINALLRRLRAERAKPTQAFVLMGARTEPEAGQAPLIIFSEPAFDVSAAAGALGEMCAAILWRYPPAARGELHEWLVTVLELPRTDVTKEVAFRQAERDLEVIEFWEGMAEFGGLAAVVSLEISKTNRTSVHAAGSGHLSLQLLALAAKVLEIDTPGFGRQLSARLDIDILRLALGDQEGPPAAAPGFVQ